LPSMTNSPRVGVVIEEVPVGPPIGSRTDALALTVLVILSLIIHSWLYLNTTTTARDSIGFAQLALIYESPKESPLQPACQTFADVMKVGKPPHPPGYPLLILTMSQVTKSWLQGEAPEVMLRTAQLTSILAAVLLVFPMYSIGKTLLNRKAGFAATAIFQLLPVSARITSDGLTEAWYLLFLLSGLRTGLLGLKSNSSQGFFRAGLYGGLAYLVRPEGMILPLTMFIVTVGFWLSRRSEFALTMLRLVVLILGTALISVPYMKTINGLTLKTTGKEILGTNTAQVPVPVPLLAASYNPDTHGEQWLWAITAILKESTKTFHYAPMGFAIFGAILALRHLRREPATITLLMMIITNSAILYKLAMREGGYISERHTLPLAAVGSLLAGYGLFRCREFFVSWLGERWTSDWVAWFWFFAMAISCVPLLVRPMHENRGGHKVIGDYLKQHATPEDAVIDPYDWAQYYSGRSLRGVPQDPLKPRYRWAVVEGGESEHQTFTRREAALNVIRDSKNKAELVVEWRDPTDPKKERRIMLYRQDARLDTPAKKE
jgi:Dolichyl-phosphate-mannose-protein mannosyltransferase